MFPLILITIAVILLLWIFRYHVISLLYYLLVRFERRKIDFQLLGSLRDELIHERKKKMAGLEMILSSWEQGEEVQPRYEYFEELLGQLKNLVLEERRNLMAVTKDVFLWGKLWNILRRIEKTSREKREKSDVPKLRKDLDLFQNLIDEVIEYATKKFSFTLNEVVKESVKVVKIEKSKLKNIEIAEQLDDVGDTVRFSYDKFRDWQRVLTNLIRNAIEAVEAKQFGAGIVVADLGLPGGEEIGWVKIITKPSISDSVSLIIEDFGIGMDEAIKSSFYKKGFTSGKEGGLGLGISEESVEFINRYGNWEVESQKGVGTKIAINIDRGKAKKAELILPPSKPFVRTKLAYGLSVFVLALIGVTLLFMFDEDSRFWEDRNPAHLELTKTGFVVTNRSGDVLWGKENICSDYDLDESGSRWEIINIDEDPQNEVLFLPEGNPTHYCELNAHLLAYDHNGDLLFERECAIQGEYPGDDSNLVHYRYHGHRVFQLDNRKVIMTSVAADYPARAHNKFWNVKGDLLGWYVQAGSGGGSDDELAMDSRSRLLFLHCNNRLRRACFYALRPDSARGVSPPYTDPEWDLSWVKRGNQLCYISFPRSDLSIALKALYDSVTRLTLEANGVRADIIPARRSEAELGYFIDNNFRVQKIYISDIFREVWDSLSHIGALPNPNLNQHLQELLNQVAYWTDSGWVTEGQLKAAGR